MDIVEGASIKNLKILKDGRDLKNVILIDNLARNYMLDLETGIPIKEYNGD
jgi:TFIIF-interacting CTD phosphatase-like protein